MFIDVDDNKLINRNAIKTVKIEGLKVVFIDKKDRVLGNIQMQNEDELDSYCEYLRGGCTAVVLGKIELYLEHMRYDLEDVAKELSKIKESI